MLNIGLIIISAIYFGGKYFLETNYADSDWMLKFAKYESIPNAIMTFLLVFGIIGIIIFFLKKLREKYIKNTKYTKIIFDIIFKFINVSKYIIALYIASQMLKIGKEYSHYVNLFFKISFVFLAIYFGNSVIKGIFKILEKSKGDSKLAKQVFPILSKLLIVLIWIVGILTVLGNLGYNISALITGAGVGGIAIALAAQKTIANLFGAITIILNKPFEVGNSVKINGITGTVEEIGITYLKLSNTGGNTVLIPNEILISSTIENLTQRENRKIDSYVGLVYETSLDELKKAISIIEGILEEGKVKEEIESYRVHFDNFGEEALVINITYFSLLNDNFIDHLKQKEKINLEIKSEFEKAGLKMAMTGKFVNVKTV